MRIIGIDQSLVNFAIVIIEDGAVIYQNTLHSKEKGVERLADIRKKFVELVMDKRNTTDIFVFEGYSFGSRGQAVFSIAELGGMLRLIFYDYGIKPMIVAPTLLKKFVTGKGMSPKEIMLKEVFRRWNYDTADNNLADAFSLAKFGETFCKIEKGEIEEITKADQECINSWKKTRDTEKLGETSILATKSTGVAGENSGEMV